MTKMSGKLFVLLLIVWITQAGCMFHPNHNLNNRIRMNFQIPEEQSVNEESLRAVLDENLPVGSSDKAIKAYLKKCLENDPESVIYPDKKNNSIICKILFRRGSKALMKKMYIIEFYLDKDNKLKDIYIEPFVSTRFFKYPQRQN